MTRTIDAVLLRSLEAAHAEEVWLLELAFDGGTLRFSTGPQDLDWNGQTWVGIGGILEIGAIQETADVDAQGVELAVSGVDQAIISAILQDEYRGRAAVLYQAHLAPYDNLVDYAEDLTQWTGAAALTGAQPDPFGGTRAYRVNDTDAGAAQQRARTVSFGAGRNGPKAFGIWVARGDTPAAAGARFSLRDTTVGVARVFFDVTFDANGTPTVAPGGGATVLETSSRFRNGFTLVRLRNTGIIAANAHQLQIVPAVGAASNTGDVRAFGAHLADGSDLPGYLFTEGTAYRGGQVIGTPLEAFRGYMNEGFELEEERERDQHTAQIRTRLLSRLARLQLVNGIRTNLVSHQRFFTGDLFFQHIPDLMNRRIFWGVDAPEGN